MSCRLSAVTEMGTVTAELSGKSCSPMAVQFTIDSHALPKAGVPYQIHVYPGTQHGFHNNSTPRYDEAAAKLAWERTVAHFRKHLA